jgi:hypothetical protein
MILENATPEVLAEMRAAAARGGAKIVEERKPQTNLERYFLEVTGGGNSKTQNPNSK